MFLAYGNRQLVDAAQVNKIVLCHHHHTHDDVQQSFPRTDVAYIVLKCESSPADDAIILLSKTIICDDALIIARKNSFESRRIIIIGLGLLYYSPLKRKEQKCQNQPPRILLHLLIIVTWFSGLPMSLGVSFHTAYTF